MAAFPWSVLGIKKTTDEKAIKSAYAAKLKLTRPDENPAGFQKLVEARDVAIAKSRKIVTKSVVEPEEPKTKPARGKKAQKIEISKPIVAVRTKAKPWQDDYDPVQHLCKCMSTEATRNDFRLVEKALSALRNFSIDEKQEVESLLLYACQGYLCPDDSIEKPFNDGNLHAGLKNHVLLKLDEEYAWTQNDRHVQEILFWGSEDFIDQLQIVKSGGKAPIFARPQLTKVQKTVGYLFFVMVALQVVRAIFRYYSR
jgi:hypothetical protein